MTRYGMMEWFVLLLLATVKVKVMFLFCSVASLQCPLWRRSFATPVS